MQTSNFSNPDEKSGSLHIEIKNGYGISHFDAILPFNATPTYPRQNTNIIYAQNGVMKSSFTKTLRDYSHGHDVKDHIFGIAGSCMVTDESKAAVSPETIISIPSFDSEAFNCENMSALLVNPSQRRQYDLLMEQYREAYSVFVGRLKSVSGVNVRTTQEELLHIVCPMLGKGASPTPESLLSLIRSARRQIEQQPDFILLLPYSIAGSADTQKFASENEGVISELMQAYDEVKASASFVRGGFDTGHAQKLVAEVEKSKFFDVDHGIELLNGTTELPEKVTSIDELKAKLATDIDVVLDKYPHLRKKFDKMVSDLSKGVRLGLKKILENKDTREIITLMNNPAMYSRRLWWGYIKGCLDEFDHLEEIGEGIEKDLRQIVDAAKAESTTWDNVVKQFNSRFRNLPYSVKISNKENVVLNDSAPEMTLIYERPIRGSKIFVGKDRDMVLKKLSTGERKAFYLLNVMFEIEIAQQSRVDHLVVLDDIVDSFDYKNKYAFLEYLYEVATNYNYIKLVILTHNFDFFRLLQLRLFGENFRNNTWLAHRQDGNIVLATGEHFKVIKRTRQEAPTDPVMWLALIPFARNIIEYKSPDIMKDTSYKILTECLHGLDITHTVQDVQDILASELNIPAAPVTPSDDLETTLLSTADTVDNGPHDDISIHNKLVLAMASRRLAENYMKSRMQPADIDVAKVQRNNFTRELYTQFVNSTKPSSDVCTILDRVNLITPEHIHVNSFMYEPLIDLGIDELRQLYQEVKALASGPQEDHIKPLVALESPVVL